MASIDLIFNLTPPVARHLDCTPRIRLAATATDRYIIHKLARIQSHGHGTFCGSLIVPREVFKEMAPDEVAGASLVDQSARTGQQADQVPGRWHRHLPDITTVRLLGELMLKQNDELSPSPHRDAENDRRLRNNRTSAT
ncbi:hypothetical protein [Sphingobium sp.]|uniref:hypothetical protein n=1 Tax=Sphingobium sp. TaxID=1912891 RepID=UPI0039B89606